MKSKAVSVRLPEDLWRKARSHARARGASLNGLILDAIGKQCGVPGGGSSRQIADLQGQVEHILIRLNQLEASASLQRQEAALPPQEDYSRKPAED